jgi:hypothetical protein
MARNFPSLARPLDSAASLSTNVQMRLIAIAVLLGTVGLIACDDNNDVTIGPNVLTGTFALQSVNGVALPAVVVDSANPPLRLDALSGAITITNNNSFTDVTTFRRTLGGIVSTRTVTCAGTYTVVGAVFEFVEAATVPDCGRTFTGVVQGTALNASVLGVAAMFTT